MKSGINTWPLVSAGVSEGRLPDGPRLRAHRKVARMAVLTPRPHRPLTPKDREYFRALREAEMKVWLAADKSTPAVEAMENKSSLLHPFQTVTAREQKRELAIFAVIAGIALSTVTAGLLQSAQFVQRWSEFVHVVRGLLS